MQLYAETRAVREDPLGRDPSNGPLAPIDRPTPHVPIQGRPGGMAEFTSVVIRQRDARRPALPVVAPLIPLIVQAWG